jgi:Taurine catabolism dioxygenase TauD, TfdA family
MSVIHTFTGQDKLVDFIKDHAVEIDDALIAKGALLLRGFKINSLSEFQKASEMICYELFDYKYGSTPRTKLGGKVYTSTEYPAHLTIPMHNENSYALFWPSRILFFCSIAPKIGGETPIADSRKVFDLIAPEIRDKFIEKGVMYVRNYGSGLDLSWEQAFQTDSKEDVMEFCKLNNIEFEWQDNKLKTWQVCQSVLNHPKHGYPVWFNQAHLFHQSANDQEMQNYLNQHLKPEELPRNSFFGDGSPLLVSELSAIKEAYQKTEISFPWQKGDLMVLDNVAYAHGRYPYEGERKIVVSMGK